jgi:hypothetical protein
LFIHIHPGASFPGLMEAISQQNCRPRGAHAH